MTTGGQPCGYGTSALARSDRLIWFHVVTLSEVGLPAGSVACWPAFVLIRRSGVMKAAGLIGHRTRR